MSIKYQIHSFIPTVLYKIIQTSFDWLIHSSNTKTRKKKKTSIHTDIRSVYYNVLNLSNVRFLNHLFQILSNQLPRSFSYNHSTVIYSFICSTSLHTIKFLFIDKIINKMLIPKFLLSLILHSTYSLFIILHSYLSIPLRSNSINEK